MRRMPVRRGEEATEEGVGELQEEDAPAPVAVAEEEEDEEEDATIGKKLPDGLGARG